LTIVLDDAKAPFMSAGTLYISFWKICLNNLPETAFVHRRIAAKEAKRYIKDARKEKRLLCLSETDLFAPYRKHERENHDALRKVLKEHFEIDLTLRDFTTHFEDDDDAGNCINPLNCFQIGKKDKLLIVNCAFGMRDRKKKGGLDFEIEPTTVTFHLFERGQ
jgi:hypothetical protein